MKVCFEKFLDKINCFVSTAKIKKKRAVEKLVMENKRDKVEEEEKE